MSLNPEFFTCDKCGHQWLFGQHGGHDCSVLLIKALKFEQGNLAHLSKINSELRADLAAAIAERDTLRAYKQAVEAAPVVALLGIDKDGISRATYFAYPHASAHIAELDAAFGELIIQELIAKPKDAP